MTHIDCGNTDCFNNKVGVCTLERVELWLPNDEESMLYCNEYASEDEDEED